MVSDVPISFIGSNDYYANLSIYPQIITRDYTDQVYLDGLVVGRVRKSGVALTSGNPIVFTGDRFAKRDYEPVFKYALALDLFNGPGYYYVRIDEVITHLILSELIKQYNPDLVVDVSEIIENVGTFALVPGETEVLVSTALETGQFFDLKSDTVFISPLDSSVPTGIKIKNKNIGNLEGEMTGGTLGVLFDTRVKRNHLISDAKVMNSFMKEIEEAVGGLEKC